jgi:hypothetical protein
MEAALINISDAQKRAALTSLLRAADRAGDFDAVPDMCDALGLTIRDNDTAPNPTRKRNP